MLDVAQLQILISLSGDKRLPHLEEEIFSNKELIKIYLTVIRRILVNQYIQSDNNESIDDTDNQCDIIYDYAEYVMKGERWIEAEHIMLQEPGWAYLYAKDIIKGRWPEAEMIISTSAHWKSRYNMFLCRVIL